MNLPSYMELAPCPPEFDEPEATADEVLEVIFGQRDEDGLGRDFNDLMNDTVMGEYHDRLAFHIRPERLFFRTIGQLWNRFPLEVQKVFEKMAEEAAKDIR